jgi:two-component system, chemotaxis family, protein-glutamate methylesterase/glutaminase
VKEKQSNKIKVLIVDDSPVSQKIYRHIIATDTRLEIVAAVSNGREAVNYLAQNKPDVVSMDLNMPKMDGMEATKYIMQHHPLPIVVSSSLYDPSQQEMAMEVLEAGAVNIMPKPPGPGHPDHERAAKQYLRLLRSMSEIKVVRRRPYLKNNNLDQYPEGIIESIPEKMHHMDYRLLLIGASAGGPEGVKAMLAGLKPGFPLPVLIVQHIDWHFTEGYRLWLQSHSKIPVLAAGDNQTLMQGHAFLAAGNKHLVVKSEGIAGFSDEPAHRGHRPSVKHLFKSAGEIYGNKCIAVLLSGMGTDGAEELKMLRDAGALTFAQNKETSLVFGMPGEAVRLGAARMVMSPENIISYINELFIQ